MWTRHVIGACSTFVDGLLEEEEEEEEVVHNSFLVWKDKKIKKNYSDRSTAASNHVSTCVFQSW